MRIALFDSGIGGLTVLSHARRVLPSEEFLFFADRDHVPYGTKSVPAVRGFVREAFHFLVEQQKADAVVVACNTATSVAVDEMRRLYAVPIIGMGGIASWEDAVEFFLAGASAVAVGTANFTDPAIMMKICDGLLHYMEEHDISHINEIVGAAHME